MKYLRTVIMIVATLTYLFGQAFTVYADECDPNDPNYYSKRAFRATNDILYFDPCAADCSTGSSGSAVSSAAGADIQKIVDEAVASGKDKGVDVRIVVSGDTSASGGSAGQIPSASTIKLLVAAALSINNTPLASISGDLTLMIRDSNNDAANRLINKAGGFGAINNAANQLGVGGEMHIGRLMMASTAGGDPNTISAKGSDSLLNTIKQSADSGGKISKEYANSIISAMKDQTINTKWGASGIPKENMAHKTGELGGAQHDVGYFIKGDRWLTVSTLTNQPSSNGNQGITIVKETAKKIYDAWGGMSSTPPASSAGCCSSGGSSGALLSGDNNAERVYNYMIGKGYTPEQAAGIVGNMILESGVNPMRVQGSALNTETPVDKLTDINRQHGEAYGIVQWDHSGKMIKPVQEKGGDPTRLADQLDFLTGDGGFTGGARDPKLVDEKLRETSTVDDAVYIFMKYFEQPAGVLDSKEAQINDKSSGPPHFSQRMTYAQAIYNKATKGEPYPPGVEENIFKGSGGPVGADGGAGGLGLSGGCGSTASDNGECQNPFRDLKNSTSLRWDGGIDYGGAGGEGPIYAVCPAEITLVQTTGSGWPGLGTDSAGAYVAYKVTSGKAKDLFVYISEDCTPNVKVGDKVDTNKDICTYKDQGTHLEIGWSEGGNNQYVKWSDYPGAANSYASNSGQDIGKFLETLGVAPGKLDTAGGGTLSNTPPPPEWPKW